jgi:hypothetical protein
LASTIRRSATDRSVENITTVSADDTTPQCVPSGSSAAAPENPGTSMASPSGGAMHPASITSIQRNWPMGSSRFV